MNKYKICVYAICKNEEKFIERWVKSMSEADEIYVLDTGSTDNSVNLLKSLGVHVKIKKINPWRFDKARNAAMDMIPKNTDICVSTDLDEVFIAGWRQIMEKKWKKDSNRMRVNYNWSFDEFGKPNISFYYEKIHDRKNYTWVNPVHEILKFHGKFENNVISEDIVINHYPDNTKPRSSYLPLLEIAVKEDPNNDRNMHYLGREYMYYQKWNDAIDTLIRHLNLKSATWKDERAASMRFIARSYIGLNRNREALMWYQEAINEAPYLRDAYIERALLYNDLGMNKEVENDCLEALKIEQHEKTYINELFSWDETVYDLLSMCAYYQNQDDEAIKWINKALEINPNNDRIKNNKKIILDEKKE